MKRIKILIAIVVLIGVVGGLYFAFLKKEKPEYSLVEVSLGSIFQEVSETGTIKKGEEINLGFKSGGKIEKIYVAVGSEIKSGEPLAKIETSQLTIQLREAEAALKVTEAQLNKLLAGASVEEIQVAESEFKNSRISLATAKEDLNQAYQDGMPTLDDSYLKLYNASNKVESIQLTYFTDSDQTGIRIRENKEIIKNLTSQAKSYLDAAKSDSKNENVDLSLSEMKEKLEAASKVLTVVREACEEPFYRDRIPSTEKSSLDTQRANINTAISNVTNSQQVISSMKLSVDLAEGKLQKAENQLALVKAKPRQEDIDLYQAQIAQAKAKVQLLENQIGESILKSPIEGSVIKIHKRIGEIAQPTLQDVVITLLPTAPFEIEANIYEEDIVKIKIGNPVNISLVAFPDKVFRGGVASIDPAEKLIEGVVYYKTNVVSGELPEDVKPGMTADLAIQTASKENVLVIPKAATKKRDNKVVVEISEDNLIKEKEIETGLEGSEGLVEVISGLKEGNKIILR